MSKKDKIKNNDDILNDYKLSRDLGLIATGVGTSGIGVSHLIKHNKKFKKKVKVANFGEDMTRAGRVLGLMGYPLAAAGATYATYSHFKHKKNKKKESSENKDNDKKEKSFTALPMHNIQMSQIQRRRINMLGPGIGAVAGRGGGGNSRNDALAAELRYKQEMVKNSARQGKLKQQKENAKARELHQIQRIQQEKKIRDARNTITVESMSRRDNQPKYVSMYKPRQKENKTKSMPKNRKK